MSRSNRILLALVAGLGFVLYGSPASALSGADWQVGNIADDNLFFRTSELSPNDIQALLISKVPSCDTWGSQAYGGTTRASYAASRGYSTPFTCLKDYSQNVQGKAADAYCSTIASGTKSAAVILYEVSNACGINSKVLVDMLEKEQGLVSDDWPWSIQYRSAMGYGCPDTAPCDAEYYGFFNQVYNAARQFKVYRNNSTSYRYRAFQFNFIQWSPDGNCGGSSVYIHNYATAGLYNYTPYQPNQAALNNLYGSGDNCSAYGNRNFWRLYNDWFGSTRLYNANATLASGLSITKPSSGTYQHETIQASYQIRNTANYSIYVGGVGICARHNGQNYDFGFLNNLSLNANQILTVSFSKKITTPGNLRVFICSYNENVGGWAGERYPYDDGTKPRYADLMVSPNPVVISPISLTPSSPLAGQSTTASMTLQNLSSQPISIHYPLFTARDNKGTNVDFPADSIFTIPAQASVTYQKARSFPNTGSYSVGIASNIDGQWNNSYPVSSQGVSRVMSFVALDNPLLSTPPSLSPASPASGQNTTASFQVVNNAPNAVTIPQIFLAVRDQNGSVVDFPSDFNVTIPANSTYTYSKTRSFTAVGSYQAFIATYRNNAWDNNYPVLLNSTVSRKTAFTVKDNPIISSGLSISPAEPVQGDTVTALFSIRNDSEQPVSWGMVLVGARDPQGAIVDFPAETNITIPPHQTYAYNRSIHLKKSGTYSFFITSLKDGRWTNSYPSSSDPSVTRRLTPNVRANPVITTGLATNPSQLTVNQTVTATFTVQNLSNNPMNTGLAIVAARDPLGRNVDFPGTANMTIPAKSSVAYSASRTFTMAGEYSLFISHYYDDRWSNAYPSSIDGAIVRSAIVRVLP